MLALASVLLSLDHLGGVWLCKRDQWDFPPFLLTSSSPALSNASLPDRLPGIPPFLHQSLPFFFLCTFSSIPARLLFYLPPALPWCPLTPLLPLLAFSQSFRHISLYTIHLPNTFYELNPFSHGVFPGLGADIDSPLASSSSFALSRSLAPSSALSEPQ